MTYTVQMPGKFDGFFSGTGVGQGQTEDDPALIELHAAYKAAVRTKRGRGYTLTLTLSSVDALEALADYADAGIVANSDEPDYAELNASRKMLLTCQRAYTAHG